MGPEPKPVFVPATAVLIAPEEGGTRGDMWSTATHCRPRRLTLPALPTLCAGGRSPFHHGGGLFAVQSMLN